MEKALSRLRGFLKGGNPKEEALALDLCLKEPQFALALRDELTCFAEHVHIPLLRDNRLYKLARLTEKLGLPTSRPFVLAFHALASCLESERLSYTASSLLEVLASQAKKLYEQIPEAEVQAALEPYLLSSECDGRYLVLQILSQGTHSKVLEEKYWRALADNDTYVSTLAAKLLAQTDVTADSIKDFASRRMPYASEGELVGILTLLFERHIDAREMTFSSPVRTSAVRLLFMQWTCRSGFLLDSQQEYFLQLLQSEGEDGPKFRRCCRMMAEAENIPVAAYEYVLTHVFAGSWRFVLRNLFLAAKRYESVRGALLPLALERLRTLGIEYFQISDEFDSSNNEPVKSLIEFTQCLYKLANNNTRAFAHLKIADILRKQHGHSADFCYALLAQIAPHGRPLAYQLVQLIENESRYKKQALRALGRFGKSCASKILPLITKYYDTFTPQCIAALTNLGALGKPFFHRLWVQLHNSEFTEDAMKAIIAISREDDECLERTFAFATRNLSFPLSEEDIANQNPLICFALHFLTQLYPQFVKEEPRYKRIMELKAEAAHAVFTLPSGNFQELCCQFANIEDVLNPGGNESPHED